MKKFLLALVMVAMTLVGCGRKNPVAGIVWVGENQYYYDVISFSNDSLTYVGIDESGNIVVPEIKLPYHWEDNDRGAFYAHLDSLILDRPTTFDGTPSYNLIRGFNADDIEQSSYGIIGTLHVWRFWSADGCNWEREDVNFRPLKLTQSDKIIDAIKSQWHGTLPILRDRHYVKEWHYGAKTRDDFFYLQNFLSRNRQDSITSMLLNGRIVRFDGKWFVRGDSATADYVLVTKERGGDKYYVDWNTLVNYSDNYSVSYHNAITGKTQSSYGGSREQLKDLEAADASLTEYEKSIEAEYERQVERELREMESW